MEEERPATETETTEPMEQTEATEQQQIEAAEQTEASEQTEVTGSTEAMDPAETPQEEESTLDAPKRPSGLLIGGFVVVVLLIVAGLFLPPVSLGERLGLGSAEEAATAESPTTEPEETAVTSNLEVPGEFALSIGDSDATVNVSAVPAADLAAESIAELPPHLTLHSNVYKIDHGESILSGKAAVKVPAGTAVEMLDLYGWNGGEWRFVPSQVDVANQQIVSPEHNLYSAFALAEAAPPETLAVGGELQPGQELPTDVAPALTELTAGTLTLEGNGDLQGEVTTVDGDINQYVHVTNVGAVVDQASLSAFLGDTTAQGNQVNALVNTAASEGYAGVNLDYQGVTAAQRDAFTNFAGSLADALHAQGLQLIITLGTPQETGGNWDSGGQDWAALGAVADVVYVEMPLNPAAYGENGTAVQLLNWATRQIDRSKLVMLVNAGAVDRIGESFQALANEDALANFGELEIVSGAEEVEPETEIEVILSGSASPLEWDGASLTYRYSYEVDDQTHFVWLGNPAALSNRLALANRHHLRGVSVQGLGNVSDGTGYAAALNSVIGAGDAPETTGAAIVWTVRDGDDSVLASESGSELTFAWEGEATPGEYSIHADFALGDDITPLGATTVTVAEAETEEVAEEEPETAASETEQPATTGALDPGNADAVVNTNANFRVGPGLAYGLIAGGLNQGTLVQVIGRNDDATWLQIATEDGQEGWIYATLLDLNSALDVSALEVVEVDPPTTTAGDGNTSDGNGNGGSPPPPVSAPPVASGSFELGGQTHTFANPQLMSSAGMNWVKFQHKWGQGDDPNGLAGRIQQAHANGFKVLLSIPGANTYPDSIDFNGYVQFLGGVAALGPDAIEVWNEMNIDFEWPAGQIDPNSYVSNMLAPAYNAIKSANANVMVISGAPAPTGFDNGTNAWSDSRYMAGMAAAGAANYLDCVGAHYNAGATPPTQSTGHPAGNDHYSWYLLPTLNVYAQLGKPVCFTELGYLSGEDYGGVPSRFSWAAGTSVQEHAAWLAQAVSTAANTGQVRMIIVFNVDFTVWGEDPQAGYAMIRKNGSCPACDSLRQVMGR